MRSAPKIAGLVGILLLIWSAVFASTFSYPFYWDDFHLIRHYNAAEVRSVFHGVVDPDKIETPGLRPVSLLLYNLQGSVFDDNIVAHRLFMVGLMGILLCVVGILFVEIGLQFFQIAIVLSVFVFSRVFAALVLWISLSHLILAYVFIVLTAYFFLRWAKSQRWSFFVLMLACATVATFTREEAYTLPVVLPLLWIICAFDRTRWREVTVAGVSIFFIACFHYGLWHYFIPNALSPQFGLGAAKRFLTAVTASWLPTGSVMKGFIDKLTGVVWIAFLIGLGLVFIRVARPRVRWQLLGGCGIGALLCLPALGIGRPFGVALPTIAFMAAMSVAVNEVRAQIWSGQRFGKWQRRAVGACVLVALLVGIGGGIRRSYYVAESLRERSALRVVRDGQFLFDLLDRPVTIPEQRRKSGLARLETDEIRSAEDLRALESALKKNPSEYAQNRETGRGLFLPKYDYLSF
jgi:hypothetical protein